MLKPEFSSQFKKDYKLAIKRGCDPQKLEEVIRILCKEIPLPENYKDHPLFGYREKDFTLPSLSRIEALRDALISIKDLCGECEKLYGATFSSRYQSRMSTANGLALWSSFPKSIADCIARNASRNTVDDWVLYLTEERAYAMSRKAQYAHVLDSEVEYEDRVTEAFYRTDYGDPENKLNEFDGFFSRMGSDYKEFRTLIKNAFTSYAHQKKTEVLFLYPKYILKEI